MFRSGDTTKPGEGGVSGSERAIGEDDLHALVDGQLDPERRRLVEHYLQSHPEEALRVAAYRAQRADLRTMFVGAGAEVIPPRLRLAALIHGRAKQTWSPWRLAASVVIGIAIGLGGGWVLFAPRTPSLPELAMNVLVQQAFTNHAVYAADARRPVEIAASEQQQLTRWLSNRLQRTVTAPDLTKFGYTLLGGRLVATERGSPAALLVYSNQEGARVSLLLRPMLPTLRVTDEQYEQHATQLCAWIANGMGYAVVSSIPRPELDDLADYIRTESSRPS
jgi:anti-sigma factor RsiW